ncbi:MAG: type II secretion system protein [Patescibacteria group bacterium]
MLQKIFKQKGFTIIELMVCVSVISIGLIGVLSLVTQNIQAQSINKNSLIAAQLSQEGIELVRNIRDKNWLTSGYSWKHGAGIGTDSDIIQDGSYIIDYLTTINQDVNAIDDDRAKFYLNSNGYYTHTSTASSTVFSRLISVSDNGDYVDIKSAVNWKEHGNNHSYVAEVYLYDWN